MGDGWTGRFTDWWLADPSLFRLPFHFWSLVAFLAGAVVGSFLNVCIHRMPLGQSVVHPPSHCPRCGCRIPLALNIPLVTWLWLRGRCAGCGEGIPVRYWLVEVLTAGVFLGTWLGFGRGEPALAGALCILWSLFIAATFIDWEHLIIPDEITLGGAVLGMGLSTLVPALHGADSRASALLASVLGILLGAGLVLGVVQMGKALFGRENLEFEGEERVVLHEEGMVVPGRGHVGFEDVFFRKTDTLRFHGRQVELADRCYAEADVALKPDELRVGGDRFRPEDEPYLAARTRRLVLPREAMGLGDVKFMATIGAFLGWKATVFALGMASLAGALVGVTLIAIGRREWSSRLPFGPYLVLGAVVWVAGGRGWWLRLWGTATP